MLERSECSESSRTSMPSIQHPSAGRIVKPGDQACDGALSDARGTHQSQRFAGTHRKGDVLKHRHAFHVTEVDVFKPDFAAGPAEANGVFRLFDVGLHLQQVGHSLGAGKSHLHLLVHACEQHDRLVKHALVQKEGDQVLHRKLALDHRPPAEKDDQKGAGGAQKLDGGMVDRHDLERGEKVVGVALGAALDPLPFVLLPGEDLDLFDARNVVLQDGVKISQLFLSRLESPPGLAAKGKDSDHQEGDRKQRQQGRLGKR